MLIKRMKRYIFIFGLLLSMLFQGMATSYLPKVHATSYYTDTTISDSSLPNGGVYSGNSYFLSVIPSNAVLTNITGKITVTNTWHSNGNWFYVFLSTNPYMTNGSGPIVGVNGQSYSNPADYYDSSGNVVVFGTSTTSSVTSSINFSPSLNSVYNTPYIKTESNGAMSYTITITSITYRIWNTNAFTDSLSLTTDQYVQINGDNYDTSMPPMLLTVMNQTTGASVGSEFRQTGGTWSRTDSSVIQGKTYYYYVTGRFNVYQSKVNLTSSQSILVPSDSYLAYQAATEAANGTNTIINSYLSTTAGVVQDSSGTVLNAARLAQTNALDAYNSANQADSDIKSLQTNMTNNFNNLSQFLTPNLKHISGLNGATATSGSSMQLVLDYSNATDYRYSVDGGSWSGWSALSGTTISVPLSTHIRL